ncbi:MAG TPA: LacI family DNA-binding transcriptional regulator [Thermomicrobiaceae bacterium]|nr:LacI family DNA-binding transcriptional regulator [Thermomicrobiaceae bacterium]
MDNAGRERPPTLEDVARRAGVSRQTISRVINDKGEVAETTRQRVHSAILELGYQPNSLARSLATRKSPVLGLVVPDITQPFYPQIARGVEDGAFAAGYSVFLCHTAGSPDRERQALERLGGQRVGGVIVCNSRLEDEILAAAVRAYPVVLVNREVPDLEGTVIWTGYEPGGRLATGHLLELGRRRIAYLGLDYPNQIDEVKAAGYRGALEGAGIPERPELRRRVANTFQGGYEAMALLAAEGVTVDAVFAFNDLMAIGAMRWALSHGWRVPEDLAVVGFGGSDLAAMVTPALSTIAVPLYWIGLTAVQEILNLIEGKGRARRRVDVRPELIVRGSSVMEQQPAALRGASA